MKIRQRQNEITIIMGDIRKRKRVESIELFLALVLILGVYAVGITQDKIMTYLFPLSVKEKEHQLMKLRNQGSLEVTPLREEQRILNRATQRQKVEMELSKKREASANANPTGQVGVFFDEDLKKQQERNPIDETQAAEKAKLIQEIESIAQTLPEPLRNNLQAIREKVDQGLLVSVPLQAENPSENQGGIKKILIKNYNDLLNFTKLLSKYQNDFVSVPAPQPSNAR